MKHDRMMTLEFLIKQRFLIKKYMPDELYGFFNNAGLEYSINEVIEAYQNARRLPMNAEAWMNLTEQEKKDYLND